VQNPLTIVRTWIFADPCGNEKSVNQIITIKDEDEIILPENQEDYTVTCLEDVLPPSELFATAGCGIQIKGALATVESGNECAKTYARTWTFTHLDKPKKTLVQTVRVDNKVLPTFTVPPDVEIECGSDKSPANTGEPTDVVINCSGNYT